MGMNLTSFYKNKLCRHKVVNVVKTYRLSLLLFLAPGDHVAEDEVVGEIETDKVFYIISN